MLKETNAVALCAIGAEKVLSNEIRKIGLKIEEGGTGRIRFKTDTAGLYRALMSLRTADRVLLEAGCFPAEDFDALFEGVRSLPWEDYIPANLGLKVAKVRTNRSQLKAEVSVQAVVHKAAAERLCEKYTLKRLPDGEDPAEIRVYIEKDKASILLDLSGEPLFKRGYRKGGGGVAPLRETTAAAMILLSLWKRKFPLYDPFCGSGTIAIEAALYAWDFAPGLFRHFALDKLLIAGKKTENLVREELLSRLDLTRPVCIAGSDADNRAVSNARANLDRILGSIAGIGKKADYTPVFETIPVESAQIPAEAAGWGSPSVAERSSAGFVETPNPKGSIAERSSAPGFIITNPPYGKRLGDAASAEKTYSEMGKLVRNFEGWKMAVITDHPGFESFFGKKADSCREITNGAMLSYLFQYSSL